MLCVMVVECVYSTRQPLLSGGRCSPAIHLATCPGLALIMESYYIGVHALIYRSDLICSRSHLAEMIESDVGYHTVNSVH